MIPLFKALTEVLPECEEFLDKAKENVNRWKNYEETETDKLVYKKKDVSSESDVSNQIQRAKTQAKNLSAVSSDEDSSHDSQDES